MSEIKEKELFVSKKNVLLNAPGVLLDDVYYNRLNSSVSLAEVTYFTGRIRQALNTTNFNATAQITINNGPLLSDLFIHLTLPALLANQAVNRAWGYGCLTRITVTYGAASLPQLALSGDGVFQTIMGQIQTAEKKAEYMNLAGEALFTAGQIPEAIIQIPLAFSSACAKHKKLPLDSSLLNSPIVVTLEFGDSERIYVDDGTVLRPTSFNIGQAYLRSGSFENKNMSLKQTLISNPSLIQSYPFIRKQSFASRQFLGQLKTGGNRVSLNLLSFINADIAGMSFAVIDLSYRSKVSGNINRWFNYDPITDIFLEFNGQTLMDLPASMYKMSNMNSIMGATSIADNFYDVNTGFTEANAKAYSTYVVYLDFSRIRSVCFENELQNVFRIGNQSLTLSFFTSKGAATTYQIHATYWYNAIIALSDGVSKIMIN